MQTLESSKWKWGHRSAELLRNRYTNMAGLTGEMAKQFLEVETKFR